MRPILILCLLLTSCSRQPALYKERDILYRVTTGEKVQVIEVLGAWNRYKVRLPNGRIELMREWELATQP